MEQYNQAKRRYDLNQAMAGQAMQPIRGASAGSTVAKMLQSYFASRGMRDADRGMQGAEQADQNELKMALSQALGAYRGDTPYNQSPDETFPGEAPIQGLRNEGSGQDVNAMAQAMMNSGRRELAGPGMTALMSQPKDNTDSKIRAYQQAQAQGLLGPEVSFADFIKLGTPSTNNYLGDWKVPTGFQRNPNKGKPGADGVVDDRDVIPLAGSQQEQTMTTGNASQSAAGNYAARMVTGEEILRRVVGGGFDPAQIMEFAADKAGMWGNFLKSPEGQEYRQAQQDWVRAKLRKESGAVIGKDEMEDEIKLYFPQPGDSPQVQAQKEIQRMVATNGMIKEANVAYDGEPYDIPDAIQYLDGKRYVQRGGKWFNE